MKLHTLPEVFHELITIVATELNISESAVERDYYIVMMLQKLADSPYADQCVFKGGTSLSKCYPGSIERFSEDIDLTYLGMDQSDKKCEKSLKAIEKIMSEGASSEKITSERNNRNKSMYVWFNRREDQVKLEIGSSIKPDPFSKHMIKSYIHEYLERNHLYDDIQEFELIPVTLNVLNIERTFLDKVMAVKRHAICGTLNRKVRHIYDVTRLYPLPEVQAFLSDTEELKRLIQLTKVTDAFYLQKRNTPKEFDPTGPYDFASWKICFSPEIKDIYESLHETLLYTDEKQDFSQAIKTFESISLIFKGLNE